MNASALNKEQGTDSLQRRLHTHITIRMTEARRHCARQRSDPPPPTRNRRFLAPLVAWSLATQFVQMHPTCGLGLNWGIAIIAALLLFAGANAHLVYVAVQSQPDCVEHAKTAGEGGGYRAAKSAC